MLVSHVTMVEASHQVRTDHDFQAAVDFHGFINDDHGRSQQGIGTAVAVPVAVVLMPFPGPTTFRVFVEHHLTMPVVDILPKQCSHGVDNARACRHDAENVVSDIAPYSQWGLVIIRIVRHNGMLPYTRS